MRTMRGDACDGCRKPIKPSAECIAAHVDAERGLDHLTRHELLDLLAVARAVDAVSRSLFAEAERMEARAKTSLFGWMWLCEAAGVSLAARLVQRWRPHL